MSLKDILAASRQKPKDQPEWNLGEVLWGYLASLNDAGDEKREEGFHPSQLFDFCPRQRVLAHFFPKPGDGYFSPESQSRMDWGTAWHWFAQNHYFGPMGLLWGHWRCNRCGKVYKDTLMPPPDLDCTPSTGPRREAEAVHLVQVEKEIAEGKRPRRGGYWTYMEQRVHTEEGIVGHVDGFLQMPWGERVLLEIKTMDGKWFKTLSAPDPKYLFQISVYLWATGVDRCLLAYFSKDADSPKPKTFWVKRDDGVVKAVKSRIALYNRSWPEKRLCVGNCTKDSDRAAEKCLWRGECWRPDIEEVVEKERTRCAPGA